MASNITLVITSCNRHALLRQTLQSFLDCTDVTPEATIIVEDSTEPAPAWIRENPFRSMEIQWVANEQRMGQIYSIDRAYSLVKTDYIFHCEDDWNFQESSGAWMSRSKAILEKYPNIIQVSLRGNTGWHDLCDPDEIDPRANFKLAMPYWRGCWGGIAFNPGLRRLSDYKKLGSYGRHVAYGTHGLKHEAQLSKMLLDQGYRIADLNQPIITHTGGTCSRAIEPLDRMPKILIAIPACHKYDYSKWESEKSPHFDKSKAYNGEAYGTDIHISFNKDDRIGALRDTWLKDLATFKEHVDYKFFYGTPHDRPALDDEVYLGCPDDYAALPLKSVEIAKYAYHNGYDFVWKGDDDTGVYVDRLIHELMSYKFDYAGYVNGKICAGGVGYWMSRRAMKAVVDNPKPDHWAEDVSIGRILNRADIYPESLIGHCPGFSDHWYFKDGFDPKRDMTGVVTFHAVQPQVMRDWYKHIKGVENAAV
jgi:hypothetical protein